jgi:hypothetical protein
MGQWCSGEADKSSAMVKGRVFFGAILSGMTHSFPNAKAISRQQFQEPAQC